MAHAIFSLSLINTHALVIFLCIILLLAMLIISVGTNVGDTALWEVGSRERLALKNFKVWDLSACSMQLQVLTFYTKAFNFHT